LIECGTPGEIKAMVKGQVVEFHPDQLEAARALLEPLAAVLEIQVYGTLLHVFVTDAHQAWPRLQALLEQDGIKVDTVRLIQPRMEEAFISLIRGRQNVKQNG
jgi:hypothetical protein